MNLRYISLSLSIALSALALTMPAKADEVTVRRTTVVTPDVLPYETIVVPNTVILPESYGDPTETTVTRQTFLNTPFDEPMTTSATTERRVVTETTAPLGTASSSSSSLIDLSASGLPVFSKRLAFMHDQINMGLAKGWLAQAQADHLLSEHDRIALMIGNRTRGIEDSDAIESRLNLLNIAIQNNFDSNTQTAGLGHTY